MFPMLYPLYMRAKMYWNLIWELSHLTRIWPTLCQNLTSMTYLSACNWLRSKANSCSDQFLHSPTGQSWTRKTWGTTLSTTTNSTADLIPGTRSIWSIAHCTGSSRCLVSAVYTYTHIHIHTYTHTHIHTYTQTHIHTYTQCTYQ